MDTAIFSTRSEYKNSITNPSVPGKHVIGLDMGYSSPKCVYEHGYFVFPNYVKRLTGELFGEMPKDALIYTNANKDTYIVGDMAMRSLTEDSVVNEDSMYGRNHYLHPEFKIVFETALGLACWNEDLYNADPSSFYIETGLPPSYMSDEPYIRAAMCGEHKFTLTKGSVTKDFNITLNDDQIGVMSQPMGTLNSLLFNDDGSYSSIAADLMSTNVTLLDGGFGTFDKFFIKERQLEFQDSDGKLGMKRILEELRLMIRREYGINISIPAMQKVLRSGKFTVNDMITMTAKEVDVTPYFEKANQKVAAEAFDSMKEYAFGVKYFIMTGGIGEAWLPIFKEKLTDLPVKVLLGNATTTLPTVLSNARGYYMKAVNTFRKRG